MVDWTVDCTSNPMEKKRIIFFCGYGAVFMLVSAVFVLRIHFLQFRRQLFGVKYRLKFLWDFFVSNSRNLTETLLADQMTNAVITNDFLNIPFCVHLSRRLIWWNSVIQVEICES